MSSPNITEKSSNQAQESIDSSWTTYTDNKFHLTFNYPTSYEIDDLHDFLYLNRTITWHTSENLVSVHRGDEPLIKKEERINTPFPKIFKF